MTSLKINWQQIEDSLNEEGYAQLSSILSPQQCAASIAGYEKEEAYRKRIVMQRHGYGQGEYRYFNYPLPELVTGLRRGIYAGLAPIANRWAETLGNEALYPDQLEDYTKICHDAGQTKPTPLILKYGPGDYNRLHQDLYGDHSFPLQMAILLSEPGQDFDGGEFILTEQRARMQSRATVVPLKKGDAVIFAVNDRPFQGIKRMSRAKMRHGVSKLLRGDRFTLGIIFHDAA